MSETDVKPGGPEKIMPAKVFNEGWKKWKQDLIAAYKGVVSSDEFEAVVDGFEAWWRALFPGQVPENIALAIDLFTDRADNFRMGLHGTINLWIATFQLYRC
jgi:hypothetical protein